MNTIVCNQCGLVLPLDSFYKNRTRLGRERTCKKCRELRESKYREVNRDHRNSVQRKRWATKSVELNTKRRAAYKEDPQKDRARLKARRKVPSQPCVICGKPAERHHLDYSRPLDVVFLCRSHHRMVHNGTIALP